MKFAVAILAVLAVASPLSALKLPASGSGALAEDIQYLFDLVPLDKMVPILMTLAANETDVHAAMKILQSNEFKLFVLDVEAIPEVKDLLQYIQKAGLDIITLINNLTSILDLDHISPLEASTGAKTIPELKNLLKYVQETGVDKLTLQKRLSDVLDLEHIVTLYDAKKAGCGGFSRIAAAVQNLVPRSKYEDRFQEKFQNSNVFSEFIRKCGQLEQMNVYLSFRSNEHYVKLVQVTEQAGISSAKCRDYYGLLMAAKVLLTLAL